jgi:5'-nucleotidase
VLTLTRTAESEYACSGAPADCVVAAMTLLFADHKPDLVLAGVNDKINVAGRSRVFGHDGHRT